MIVYADILFCLNLIITYFLLMLTARLARANVKFRRLLLGALAGGLASFIMLLPIESEVLAAALKLAAAAIIVLCCFGCRNFKVFLRHVLLFFAATFAYAGVMLAIWFAFKPKNMVIDGGTVYFGISPIVLIASAAAAHLIITLIRRFSARRTEEGDIYRIKITLDGGTCALRALLDTGNALCDLFTDAPIIVTHFSAVKDLLPFESCFVYEHQIPDCPDSMFGRFRVVPYASIGGEGLLPGFKADRVDIRTADGRVLVCPGAVIAVTKSSLSGDYDALFGRDLLNKSEGVVQHDMHAVHK